MHPAGAVIFDMDGTLTRPYFDFDAIRREIGLSAENRTPILEALEHMTPAQRQRAEAILLRHEECAARECNLWEDALHVLDQLRRRGLRIGLLTRNSRQSVDTVIARHAMVLDHIHTREDGPVKPSPDAILRMCRTWEVDPARAWVVGDYLFDIQAGHAAGATTILMLGDAERPEWADQADHVVRRLAELLDLLPPGR